MDTITFNHVTKLFVRQALIVKQPERTGPSLLGLVSSRCVGVYCWWYGFVQVNERQEVMARRLAYSVNSDLPNLEAIAGSAVGEKEVVGGKLRRNRRAPYAAWLVQTIRGRHLSQCVRTEASVLVFERHARSIMAEHGLRPTDAARVLPYAVGLFFDHRTVDQIDAVAITNTAVFKSSVEEYSARYFSWGQAAAQAEA
ncbi:hypothetical protein [Erysiphe necator associated tombus-like virus 7]|nr:hypothetical protein [Erysiphe necator associated tombus-like virus 7]